MKVEQISNLSVGRLLKQTAEKFPKKEVIIFEDKRLTFRQLDDQANKLANGIIKLGIQKGDKAAILFQNSNQFIESYFAIVKAGGIAVPLNSRLSAKELTEHINFSDSKMLIYSNVFAETVESIRKNLTKVKRYIIDGANNTSESIGFEEIINGNSPSEPGVEVNESDGCEILFTGGTTGAPKGVYRTHYSVIWSGMLTAYDLKIKNNAKLLVTAPLFHGASLDDLMMGALTAGATMCILRQFDPMKCLEKIRDEKLTVAFFVPLMFTIIMMMPNVPDYVSSLETWGSAAAPMPLELRDKLLKTLPDINLFEVFGQTENPWISVMYSHNSMTKYESCGIPATHNSIKIVGNGDQEIPVGQIGEIVVKGPSCMSYYYKNDGATRQTLKNGWLYTGDLGKFDEDGYLYIVDRKKDMIITGGENVYAVEVENALILHPKVQEVSVIGLPHKLWGEAVTAVIVTKPGSNATEEEIIVFAKEKLTHYKCPRIVKFTDSLPKSTMMKVLKQELKKKYID